MVRWIRIASITLVALGFVALGVVIGLYLVANGRWVPIDTPELLHGLLGKKEHEVWLPALLGGWLIGVLGIGLVLSWAVFYVWRRRQGEALIRRLERELAALRNLPLSRPAPIEDLPDADADLDADLDERGEAVVRDPVADGDHSGDALRHGDDYVGADLGEADFDGAAPDDSREGRRARGPRGGR